MQFFMEYQIFSVARPNAVLKEIFLMNLKVSGAFPLYEISISLRSLGSSRCAGFHGRLTWLGEAFLLSKHRTLGGGENGSHFAYPPEKEVRLHLISNRHPFLSQVPASAPWSSAEGTY